MCEVGVSESRDVLIHSFRCRPLADQPFLVRDFGLVISFAVASDVGRGDLMEPLRSGLRVRGESHR